MNLPSGEMAVLKGILTGNGGVAGPNIWNDCVSGPHETKSFPVRKSHTTLRFSLVPYS